MPTLDLYQIDAFTDRPFAGNPAAVVPLSDWLPDATLQAIALENNLSETAFIRPRSDGDYDLRWFTPTVEVKLCGHATLASGWVVLSELEPHRDRVQFHTLSGVLSVERGDAGFVMRLPADPPKPIAAPPGLVEALGARPEAVVGGRDCIAVFDSAAAVRALEPDLAAIAAMDIYALVATAPGGPSGGLDGDVDFVSRFFAPARGVPEDPVTGSAHCGLTPYWVERLGRNPLRARQVSARTGELGCRLAGDRVVLTGHAVAVLTGALRF